MYKENIGAQSAALAQIMEDHAFSRYRAYPLPSASASLGVLEVFDDTPDMAESHRFLSMLASTLGIAASLANNLAEAERIQRDMSVSYDETLEAWVRMLELRDQETEGHSRRVTAMTLELAEAYGIHGEGLDNVRRGALLHDIGKIGVPDSILLKAGILDEEERVVMRQHPSFAQSVMSSVPFLAQAVDIPYCHHERWDGAGYPRGIGGISIPLSARLFAVVDVWDALRSNRPYRASMGTEEAFAIIASGAGSQFDPDVVALFLELRKAEIIDTMRIVHNARVRLPSAVDH
jgi:putative nucleotidyltransferase with HDIG domain